MKIYTVKEFGGKVEIKAASPLVVLRKIIRKTIKQLRHQNPNIDIYTRISKMNITVLEIDTKKQTHYIVSVVKNATNNSLYYKLDYELEVYKKLNNI